MSVWLPQLRPGSLAKPKRRKQLWDGLTIALAIAVVLLGLAIFFAPKPESHTNSSPTKQLPSTMASISPEFGEYPFSS